VAIGEVEIREGEVILKQLTCPTQIKQLNYTKQKAYRPNTHLCNTIRETACATDLNVHINNNDRLMALNL